MSVLCVLVCMVPFVSNAMVIGETVTSKLSVPSELVVVGERGEFWIIFNANTLTPFLEESVDKRIAINLDIRLYKFLCFK